MFSLCSVFVFVGRTFDPSLVSSLSLVSLPSLVSFLLLIYFSLFLIKKKMNVSEAFMVIPSSVLGTLEPCLWVPKDI